MRPNARDSSSRLRAGVQSRACHLQGSNGLRAIHCREIEQELFQWFPSFQVVEQVLYGRTRPAEHGDTALNPWVFLYDLIVHCRLLNAGTEKVTTPRSATSIRIPCHRCTRRSSWHQQQQAVEWEREGRRFCRVYRTGFRGWRRRDRRSSSVPERSTGRETSGGTLAAGAGGAAGTAAEAGVEQVADRVAEHVGAVHHDSQEDPRPHGQPRRHLACSGGAKPTSSGRRAS